MRKPLSLPKMTLAVYGLAFIYISILYGAVIQPTIAPHNVRFDLVPFSFLLTIRDVCNGVILSGCAVLKYNAAGQIPVKFFIFFSKTAFAVFWIFVY